MDWGYFASVDEGDLRVLCGGCNAASASAALVPRTDPLSGLCDRSELLRRFESATSASKPGVPIGIREAISSFD